MIHWAFLLALAAPNPEFVVVEPLPAVLSDHARTSWQRVQQRLRKELGVGPLPAFEVVTIRSTAGLRGSQDGSSRPGQIGLRADGPRLHEALAHEVAHQVLLAACPEAGSDPLLQEAFAMVAADEVDAWLEGPYLSLPEAHGILARSPDLDRPSARRALARILAEGDRRRLPRAVRRRIQACVRGGSAGPSLHALELDQDRFVRRDALVILHRHSGALLVQDGAASIPMPFGSVLKPFVVARRRPEPSIIDVGTGPAWACGVPPGHRMTPAEAVARSCNGWFLAWEATHPEASDLGSYGELFRSLGSTPPGPTMPEVIGLQSGPGISPWAMAEAYRALLATHPEVEAALRGTASFGTLAGLEASDSLARVATKTGTVRNAQGDPALGWLVLADSDLIVVMVAQGRAPRSFAAEMVGRWQAVRKREAQGAADVQILGWLPPVHPLRLECSGVAWSTAERIRRSPVSNLHQHRGTTARWLCLGGRWTASSPALPEPRHYAGVVSFSEPNGQQRPSSGAVHFIRRGSPYTLTTSRARYAAGVAVSEDAELRGAARQALLILADRNGANRHRHPGRPLCDRTHCQAFRGTTAPTPHERAVLARTEVRSPHRWWPFHRGTAEPWKRTVTVPARLGSQPRHPTVEGGGLRWSATIVQGHHHFEASRRASCLDVMDTFGLPGCPDAVVALSNRRWRFEGTRHGHGLGLDIEWAKNSGLSSAELLLRVDPDP